MLEVLLIPDVNDLVLFLQAFSLTQPIVLKQ